MLNLARNTCVLVLFLLAACGQKGPLYLPEQTAAEAPAASGESATLQNVPDASQDGEPVPDIIPEAMPGPADPDNDEDF